MEMSLEPVVMELPSFSVLPGDLLFVKGRAWLDKPIIFITRSPYTHVAGYLRINVLIEAQGLRKTGYQSPNLYRGQSEVYTCDVLTPVQRHMVMEFVQKEIGTRYDYLLIAWEAVRLLLGWALPYLKTGRRICSTLWADAYRSIGVDLCPGVKYPTPGELAQSPLLRKIGSF